jgi:hypothetical protein
MHPAVREFADASRIRVMETFGGARKPFVIRHSRFGRAKHPYLSIAEYVVPCINSSDRSAFDCPGMPLVECRSVADQRVVSRVSDNKKKKRRKNESAKRHSFADEKFNVDEYIYIDVDRLVDSKFFIIPL